MAHEAVDIPVVTVCNCRKHSQRNVMDAHRSLYSVVVINQPKKDNNNQR
jgi:hypothetical protein